MKARVKINLPGELTKKDERKDAKEERRKKLISYKAPNLSAILGSSNSSNKLSDSSIDGGVQNMMSDSQRIDHNNLPYAWRRAGGHGHKTDAAATRKNARQPRVRPLKGRSTSNSSLLSNKNTLYVSKSSPSIHRSGSSVQLKNHASSRVSIGTQPEKTLSPSSKAEDEAATKSEKVGDDDMIINYIEQSMDNPPLTQVPSTKSMKPAPIGSDEPIPEWWDQPSFVRLDQSRMPLEAFDDLSLESKSLSKSTTEWLHECREGKVQYYADGTWRWRKVIINSYNSKT